VKMIRVKKGWVGFGSRGMGGCDTAVLDFWPERGSILPFISLKIPKTPISPPIYIWTGFNKVPTFGPENLIELLRVKWARGVKDWENSIESLGANLSVL